MIILYSTNCPKCRVIEKKLVALDKEFELVTDTDKVLKFAEEHNEHSAPLLDVDGQVYNFSDANKLLNTLNL